MVPTRMTAVPLPEFGDPDVLRMTELPVPRPGPGEVLVRVGAVSVGRTLDVATRAGGLPFSRLVSLPHVLGADHAGTVAALGPGGAGPPPGTRVAAFPVLVCGDCDGCEDGRPETCARLELLGVHRPGAYAQFCVVPEENLYPVPDDVSDEQAAALALNGAVAVRQLAEAALRPGDWVLVPAAAGALGSAVVTLARRRGIRIAAGTRHAAKHRRLQQIGADLVLDPADPGTPARLAEATGGRGVRAIIDNVADPAMWPAVADVLAPGGTVVCSGALGPARVQLDLRRMYLRSQSIRAVRTARPADAVALWKEVAAGFRVPLDPRPFTLAGAAAAHRHVESDAGFGRVVLSVP